ncbi:uncharacterized protein PAC_12401 [Phialocephala subalpina]|uniref:Uncharacterized protein n=1 Tax=Phialocephala subalpina TaxID=576137 RepID=A0A1L7XBU6_9HELO|nr:uncharacterized protein PAC_12401 [Phialocephala subalpina]
MIMTEIAPDSLPPVDKEGSANPTVNTGAEALNVKILSNDASPVTTGPQSLDSLNITRDVSSYNGIDYNSTERCQDSSFLPAFDSDPAYETIFPIQQASANYPNDCELADNYRNTSYQSHDEYDQNSRSWIIDTRHGSNAIREELQNNAFLSEINPASAVGYSQTQTVVYPDKLQAHAGSAVDFNIESSPRALIAKYPLERYQPEAWIRQRSDNAMTWTEKLEKNKNGWHKCL